MKKLLVLFLLASFNTANASQMCEEQTSLSSKSVTSLKFDMARAGFLMSTTCSAKNVEYALRTTVSFLGDITPLFGLFGRMATWPEDASEYAYGSMGERTQALEGLLGSVVFSLGNEIIVKPISTAVDWIGDGEVEDDYRFLATFTDTFPLLKLTMRDIRESQADPTTTCKKYIKQLSCIRTELSKRVSDDQTHISNVSRDITTQLGESDSVANMSAGSSR